MRNCTAMCKSSNTHDPFAVAVYKEGTIVGHVPRIFSAVCYVFLNMIHSRNNHWITASTIFSSPGSVDVYNSLFDDVDCLMMLIV